MSSTQRGDLVGYGFLTQHLGLKLPMPSKVAKCDSVSAMTETDAGWLVPVGVCPPGHSVLDHVMFALKFEGVHMGVLKRALPHLDTAALLDALKVAPNSLYLHKVGFLYEALTGDHLGELPSLGGGYVDLFDPRHYYTGESIRNTRWKVNFNGLGSINQCVTVRRTPHLEALVAQNILAKVAEFYQSQDDGVLDRAMSWAYLSETDGSFAIEHETPTEDKKMQFVRLLQQAHEPRPMSEDYLVELQNSTITNPFDCAVEFRTEQNWLRKRGIRGPAGVSYIPPKPEDVDAMMAELISLINRRPAEIDPIMLGAIASFQFVFIHPFMDGNGRLSRFLMHYVLCQSQRLPHGLVLPVSVAMKRHEQDYLNALLGFSRPTRDLWRVVSIGEDQFSCATDADDTMYRYWDATECVEFAYRMAESALNEDLIEETNYLHSFDKAYHLINDAYDVRDTDLHNMIMWCVQNKGVFPKGRREKLSVRYQPEVFECVEQSVAAAFAYHEE